MQLTTDRLILRELTMEDFQALYEILSDKETMKHYPSPFTKEKVTHWIEWNIDNYATYGFGLWAVVLKENHKMIGDCGITMQNIHGQSKPEIGYHIHKDYQNHGYATEAAIACKDYLFSHTSFPAVYTYMKYTNVGSYTVAMKNGMKFAFEYENPTNTITKVYSITREEWEQQQKGSSV